MLTSDVEVSSFYWVENFMKKSLKNLIAGSFLTASIASQANVQQCDLAKGEKVYSKCSACHSLAPNKNLMGPSLYGVFDRKAGALKGFKFSQAMANSNIKWTASDLDEFLLKPVNKVPGTTMPFSGLRNPKSRAAVLCYIQNKTNSE